MAYPSQEVIFDAVYDKVASIVYLDEKWSISLGFSNYRHPQLCLWTHSIEDGWVETGRVDCVRRSLSTGVCSVLVTTTEEVTVWQLHKNNFARDKVICFVEEDVGNICERLNNADRDAVSEYLIEFILSSHDLKKSASGLRRFLLRAFPGEWGPPVTQATLAGAGGSKKRVRDPPRDPPIRQVSDSQKKSLPSSQSAQAGGSSRGTASQSRSTGSGLKVARRKRSGPASQNVGSTSAVGDAPSQRLSRVQTHLEVQKSESKDERMAFQESLFENHAIQRETIMVDIGSLHPPVREPGQPLHPYPDQSTTSKSENQKQIEGNTYQAYHPTLDTAAEVRPSKLASTLWSSSLSKPAMSHKLLNPEKSPNPDILEVSTRRKVETVFRKPPFYPDLKDLRPQS
ncbi:unnamed protein product [Calypogeia fissa]